MGGFICHQGDDQDDVACLVAVLPLVILMVKPDTCLRSNEPLLCSWEVVIVRARVWSVHVCVRARVHAHALAGYVVVSWDVVPTAVFSCSLLGDPSEISSQRPNPPFSSLCPRLQGHFLFSAIRCGSCVWRHQCLLKTLKRIR